MSSLPASPFAVIWALFARMGPDAKQELVDKMQAQINQERLEKMKERRHA